MVWLHWNRRKDHRCHQLCLQRNLLEEELKYWMFTEYRESTIIQSEVMTTVHPTAFPTLTIRSTGTVTWIIQIERRPLWGRQWIRCRARQLLRGSGIPWAAGCVCRSKCALIHSANREVEEKDWKAVGDGQCYQNQEDQGKQKKWDRMGQYIFSRFFMLLDREFHLENYDGRILTSYV